MKKRFSLTRLLLLALPVLTVLTALQAHAQPGSGGPTPTPSGAPIDGGASLLLIGGVGYTLRKLRQRRAH